MKIFLENLKKKIGNYFCPEPEKAQSNSVIIFTFDTVEGTAISYVIDFGKTMHVMSMDKSSEITDWIDNIYLDKFSVVPVKLDALRIFQKKGGKNGIYQK